MQSVNCDICKKKVDNPITGYTFFYFAEYSLCESCRDSLELQLKSTIRTKEPYAIEWYDKWIGDSISKAIQKGKV